MSFKPRQPLPLSMRKYWVGDPVTNMEQIVSASMTGTWIFYRTPQKATHPSWIVNQSVSTLDRAIRSQNVWLAKRNPDFPYIFRALWMHHRVKPTLSEWWVRCSDLPRVEIKAKHFSQVMAKCQLAVPGTDEEKRFEVTFSHPRPGDF